MIEKFIQTQEELDLLKDGILKDEKVIIDSDNILTINFNIKVYGILQIRCRVNWQNNKITAWGNSNVEAWGNSNVVALENSNVVAWGNSNVEAWGNSNVVALENSNVVAQENSNVEAWGNSNVVALENSNVVARGNSNVEAQENSNVVAWGNSNVEARGNSNVEARENSNVEAWGNSNVEAWGNSCIRVFSTLAKIIAYNFSVIFKHIDLNITIEKKHETVCIQEFKQQDYFERHSIDKEEKIIQYKKVSKDFKTQENTENETLWIINTVVTHPCYNPKLKECGKGKFHACAKPYFCDEFRNKKGDIYIAIEIKLEDLYEWKDDPQYPHKIGFRKGKVLYQCDRFGKKIN